MSFRDERTFEQLTGDLKPTRLSFGGVERVLNLLINDTKQAKGESPSLEKSGSGKNLEERTRASHARTSILTGKSSTHEEQRGDQDESTEELSLDELLLREGVRKQNRVSSSSRPEGGRGGSSRAVGTNPEQELGPVDKGSCTSSRGIQRKSLVTTSI